MGKAQIRDARGPAHLVRIDGERLDSWKAIAHYLKRDVRTVQRWEETDGLPVYRRAQGRLKGSPVYAFTSEIDAWLHRNPPANHVEQPETPQERSGGRQGRWIRATAVSLLLVGVLAAGIWLVSGRRKPPAALRVVSLTTYSGMERNPAFSPDGKQLAFSWNGDHQDNFDIYVKYVDGEEPLRLTNHPGVDGWPAWSPDGHTIAFGRYTLGSSKADILTVQALGGGERHILELPEIPAAASYWPLLAWSADGQYILANMRLNADAAPALVAISAQTGQVRSLTEPVAGSAGDCSPAVSPDGRKVAFLRSAAGRKWNLFVLPVDADTKPVGEPRQLTDEPDGVLNPMWTADSREVLYVSNRNGTSTLWRVPWDGSRASAQIESLAPIGHQLAISPHGDRLAYVTNQMNSDLWRLDLPDGKLATRMLSSSTPDFNPEIAPDGKHIAFISERSLGTWLWVSDLDGTDTIRLAPVEGSEPGPVRWSPDGKRIIFQCLMDGNDDICVVSAGGGAVRRVTQNGARDLFPSWSRDGQWIYFSSNRSGSFQIWKVSEGADESEAVQLTRDGGLRPVESADGTTVLYTRETSATNLWSIPAQGGEESPLGGFEVLGCKAQGYSVAAGGFFYITSTDPERWFEIWRYRISTGMAEKIARMDGMRIRGGLSVSRDGRWLSFSASELQSADLLLVENFH